MSRCMYNVGSGKAVSFWNIAWLKEASLKVAYPNLFAQSDKKNISVAEAGTVSDNLWNWGDIGIQFPLDLADFNSMENLSQDLQAAAMRIHDTDRIIWINNPTEGYSAKDGYDCIHAPPVANDRVAEAAHSKIFERLWTTKVPQRIKAFGWRCFWNRLATKELLSRRGCLGNSSDVDCCFCSGAEESLHHLFLTCPATKKIWEDIGLWFGITVDLETSVCSSFNFWFNFFKNKKIKEGKEGFIWLVVCWNIWYTRNAIIFKNESFSWSDLRWNIKISAWKWLSVGNITHTNCNFYNFCKDPLLYLV